jgi:hypothetical protein
MRQMKATSDGACGLRETFRQREKTVQHGPTRVRAAQIPRLAPAIIASTRLEFCKACNWHSARQVSANERAEAENMRWLPL